MPQLNSANSVPGLTGTYEGVAYTLGYTVDESSGYCPGCAFYDTENVERMRGCPRHYRTELRSDLPDCVNRSGTTRRDQYLHYFTVEEYRPRPPRKTFTKGLALPLPK